MADAILAHHVDLTRSQNISPVCRIVYIANYVANNFGFANKVIDSKIEPFDEKKLLGFGVSMEALENIVDETKGDLESVSEILYK